MNTSNSDFAQDASLPDIEQLTQLANELFTALPCDGSRIGLAASAVPGGLTSSLPGADKSAIPQGFDLPEQAELQKLLAPRHPSFDSVPDSLDTGSVFGNPSSTAASPLAGLDKSVLKGILPQDFGLPDEAQLQQLLVSRVPSGSSIPVNVEAGSIPAVPSTSTGVEQLAKVDTSPQAIEAQLQKLFAANSVDKSGGQKSTAHPTFDASLIVGLSPQAYGLPGETELQQLFGASVSIPASTESGSSFYFLDELKSGGFNSKAPALASAHPAFDVQAVRRDFPILKERVNGQPLVWFDNAATTQKPQAVIDRVSYFYEHENSNIHRAAHELAARSTDAYEKARDTVARFMNASSSAEIVFARGTTEAINLVAQSWGRQHIGAGDEIVITWLEHHANIVPWKQLCDATGATLRVVPVDDDGQVLLGEYQKLLNSRTKLVSFTQVSNALGTVTPAREMIEMAHRVGARVLLDGAQSVSHLRVDVQALDCDWFVFSGHKIFGPTGIGVLFGKTELLEAMPPWQGGGNMIDDVTFEKIVYQPAPARFEAGTGNIADAVGLGAALEYLLKIGIDNIARYEHELLVYAMDALRSISGLRLIGTAAEKTSVLSFVLDGHSNQDIGVALNRAGIAVRTGHHCAQPILRRFGLESTVRPSLAFYNTHQEVDRLVSTVRRIQSGKDF
ncbi:MAG TPA: family 2A encapsulin nanocompartment cargo protein cysteine desulfurase [Methylobacter sp.]|jgi:cysteine desulfurase/selenocysteine lyase